MTDDRADPGLPQARWVPEYEEKHRYLQGYMKRPGGAIVTLKATQNRGQDEWWWSASTEEPAVLERCAGFAATAEEARALAEEYGRRICDATKTHRETRAAHEQETPPRYPPAALSQEGPSSALGPSWSYPSIDYRGRIRGAVTLRALGSDQPLSLWRWSADTEQPSALYRCNGRARTADGARLLAEEYGAIIFTSPRPAAVGAAQERMKDEC